VTATVTRRGTGEDGFTLIETLVALALMGLVLSALASITAQWLPSWNHGVDRIQRSEEIGIALQRIGADLASAEYVPANRFSRHPLFDGSELSVIFVRAALGPNVGPGLEVVRLGETTDHQKFVTVRSRTRFTPLPPVSSLSPFRLSFAYAGPDRIWKTKWRDAEKLPALIRLTVRDAGTDRVLSVSTVAPIHVQGQGDCLQPDGKCGDKSGASPEAPDNAQADTAKQGETP
jgi:general secretion pathway protein J